MSNRTPTEGCTDSTADCLAAVNADADRAVVPVFGYLTRRRFPPRVASTADGSVRDDAVAVWGLGDALGPDVPVYVRGVHPDSGLLFLDGAPVDAEGVAAVFLQDQMPLSCLCGPPCREWWWEVRSGLGRSVILVPVAA